ncbi:MAG: enoyl-CoA hydratase/isomerase family protein [Anaerolineaceae bacterium]
MSVASKYGDVSVGVDANGVAKVEIHRPPNNFFDAELIASLSSAYEAIDGDPACRAIVLCAEGKHFCAGANFAAPAPTDAGGTAPSARNLYSEAARLIEAKTPVVAAINGAAIGGGLGLACAADFRVGSSETRMASNFAQLGFHHGFGLTITLPPIVGQQRALELLLTGKRISGEEAYRIGLLDRIAAPEEVRAEAHRMAAEIASSAPLAVASIRATMRAGIGQRYRDATDHENAEQSRLRMTEDFREGIKATAERRPPVFRGS